MTGFIRLMGRENYHYDLGVDLVGIKIKPYSTQNYWPPEAKRDFCLPCLKGLISRAEPR